VLTLSLARRRYMIESAPDQPGPNALDLELAEEFPAITEINTPFFWSILGPEIKTTCLNTSPL
jgi:hypothetical protein